MRDLRASARANGGKTLREVQWRRSLELVNRLTQNPDRRDAHAVHEIDIADFDEREGDFAAILDREDGLAALVKALPNLRHFRAAESKSSTFPANVLRLPELEIVLVYVITSLGPHWDVRFLTGLTGHANALRSLTVKNLAINSPDHCPELDRFIRSFSTLEKLTIKGRLVSVETLSSHPRLKQLCVHMFELPRGRDVPRPVFNLADLAELDVSCPHLEVLKIDVNHPIAMLAEATKPLAIGFDNLRHLTLHLEVGLTWPFPPWRARITDIKPLHPELNETMAKEFGQAFFAWRPESKLQTLSLKTGEKRPPSRIVRNAQEEAAARTAHMCRSASRNGKLVVKVERRCPSEKD
ncbi:hypothetical protein N7470_004950 [Penicillium chermesinum]|nr:hypothetical protein N7470_004950 [Penicillium chermesinum]